MIDKINKFLALIVSVNYYIYLVLGLLLGIALYFLGLQTSTADHLNFLKYIGISIVMFSLIVRMFCMVFYQKKYDEFPFRQINHRRHIGIPRTDDIFYSVISEVSLNRIRKVSGYIYAVSKPLIFINFGIVIVSLLFVMNSRA